MTELARLIRSPKSLLVFEAVARHGSFSRAAQEFNISQPSVSRNIALLEQDVGLLLLVRGARGAELTAAGRVLYLATAEGLARISEALIGLRNQARSGGGDVVLSLSNAFVTNWLTPRLTELTQAFPDVVLRFDLVAGTRTKVAGEVDLASLIVDNAPPEFTLAPELIMPVCSPAYLAARGALVPGQGAQGHAFLHLSDHPAAIWNPVLGPDLKARRDAIWQEFSDYAAIMQAAQDGNGIALGWINVAATPMRNGRLVPAWPGGWLQTGRVVGLVSTRPGPMRPVVRAIAAWLRNAMAADLAVVADGSGATGPRPDVTADSVASPLNSVE